MINNEYLGFITRVWQALFVLVGERTAWAYWSRRARELIRAQSGDAAGVAPGERVGEAVERWGDHTERALRRIHIKQVWL